MPEQKTEFLLPELSRLNIISHISSISEWTFLIALSEGRGEDYSGGGTYFQSLNSIVHLQRSQMLIFRGKLRHSGVQIAKGSRYLLVGFLVQAK